MLRARHITTSFLAVPPRHTVTVARAGLQNLDTRWSKGMQRARPPRADAGLLLGYFSRRLISGSCQLKQGWQPAGWRLQHGRAR